MIYFCIKINVINSGNYLTAEPQKSLSLIISEIEGGEKGQISLHHKKPVKNPGPEDLALIYPQRRFVLPVISVFFGIME